MPLNKATLQKIIEDPATRPAEHTAAQRALEEIDHPHPAPTVAVASQPADPDHILEAYLTARDKTEFDVRSWPPAAQQLFLDVIAGPLLGFWPAFDFAGAFERAAALYRRTESAVLKEHALSLIGSLERGGLDPAPVPADVQERAKAFLVQVRQ